MVPELQFRNPQYTSLLSLRKRTAEREEHAPTTAAAPVQYSNPTPPAHHEMVPPTIPTTALPAMQPAYSQTPPDHNNYNQPQGRASDGIWKPQ